MCLSYALQIVKPLELNYDFLNLACMNETDLTD